ncbi:MAG: tryptophan synthase subunit alpha [Algiphilus sp.]|uniref:tryptophan synthase subunit alpha n=1 Tax=Algiphilus sp. TaxID=1872431 RepID=UPI0032EE82B3
MSRITTTLDRLRTEGRKALVPFITAGDPHPDYTVGFMHALVRGGADILELGVPFSDPMADGPVIQKACERALRAGTSLRGILELVRQFRAEDSETPVVLMGYLNPIDAFGLDAFGEAARDAGVDGVLVVDLSIEEAPETAPQLRGYGLDCIFLLAPTSTPARMEAVAAYGSGYVYYVSLKGVTGSSQLDPEDVAEHVREIRAHLALPVAVGFGVRDAQSAQAVGRCADGVIVGSALVQRVAELAETPELIPEVLESTARALRDGLDALA